jgi:hypothetical protein
VSPEGTVVLAATFVNPVIPDATTSYTRNCLGLIGARSYSDEVAAGMLASAKRIIL